MYLIPTRLMLPRRPRASSVHGCLPASRAFPARLGPPPGRQLGLFRLRKNFRPHPPMASSLILYYLEHLQRQRPPEFPLSHSCTLLHSGLCRASPRMGLGGYLRVDHLVVRGMRSAGLSSATCIIAMHCGRSMKRGLGWVCFRFARLSNNLTSPLAS